MSPQDAGDSNELQLLQEFSDNFILLRDRSRQASRPSITGSVTGGIESPTREPFPATDPLPDIGQPKAQVTNLNEREVFFREARFCFIFVARKIFKELKLNRRHTIMLNKYSQKGKRKAVATCV